jgi:hypothetical protein
MCRLIRVHQHVLTLGFAAAIALFGAGAALAQTGSTAATSQINDHDITRGELDRFDNYLDSHPDVAKDLRKNPSLVNDSVFVNSHPGLKDFLKDHPGVREEIKENPQQFMNRERRFELSGRDINRGELRRADNYFDSHPEVARELSKNPKLVDDRAYVNNHPGLKDFLEDHPKVREDIKEHPNAFMKRERKFERSGADIDRGEIRKADNYFDSHPEVAKELRKNPKLVDDRAYVNNHPGLKDFLEDHPKVREDIKSHPNAFMKRYKKYEGSAADERQDARRARHHRKG